MRFPLTTVAFVACLGEMALAAPVHVARQLAGTGSACNSIVSDFDTMVGDASRGTGENLAGGLAGAGNRRQLAGTGSACDSVVSDFDTMLGTGSRGAGEEIGTILTHGSKRQLNGIADGITAPLKDFSATSSIGETADSQLNTLDGQLTDGQAQVGQQVGDLEVNIGDTIAGQGTSGGSPAPPPPPGPAAHHKRQLNGIADGVTAPLRDSAGTATVGDELDSYLNNVDGQLTDGQAEFGQQIGGDEVSIGEAIANGGSTSGNAGGGTAGTPPPPPPHGPK